MSDHNTSVRERFNANRRLAMLRFLAEEPDGSLNVSLLKDAMTDIGAPIRRPEIMAQADWMQEQGLVYLEHMRSIDPSRPIIKLTITGQGRDVVAGEVLMDGVKDPRRG